MLDLDGWLHEQQTFFWSAWMNETTKHRTKDLMIKPRLDATDSFPMLDREESSKAHTWKSIL
jgi:hypothetical protein